MSYTKLAGTKNSAGGNVNALEETHMKCMSYVKIFHTIHVIHEQESHSLFHLKNIFALTFYQITHFICSLYVALNGLTVYASIQNCNICNIPIEN